MVACSGIWQLVNIGFFYSSFDVERSMFDVHLFKFISFEKS